jgi:hypothetical protein
MTLPYLPHLLRCLARPPRAARVLIPLMVVACSDTPVDPTLLTSGTVPGTLVVNDGDGQSAVVGTAVATAPSVIARDTSNAPVQGIPVTFAVQSGGGNITGASQTTDASGVARVGSWTLGTTAGTNTLTATVALSGVTLAAVTFTATGLADAASQVAVNGGNNQSAWAGTAVGTAPSVVVQDQFGNPVAGVAVTFAVTGGGGSLTGANQTTGTNGVASVGSWTLGTTAGTNTLTATSAGLSGSPATFTATGTTPGSTTLYYNSSEPGCDGSDPNTLLCDDFESGFWYTADADHGGGTAAQKGWYGTIYANPITPPGAAVCGGAGFLSSCAASSGVMPVNNQGNMAKHGLAGGAQVTEAWFRVYFQHQSDYVAGHEKMLEVLASPNGGTILVGTNNYFGSNQIRAINKLHASPAYINNNPHPTDGWLEPNVAPQLTLINGHWYYYEFHVKLNTPGQYNGVFEAWLDDLGPNGTSGPATPTKRWDWSPANGNHGLMWLDSGETYTIGGIWLENWANKASYGTEYYDNVRVAKAGPIGFVK